VESSDDTFLIEHATFSYDLISLHECCDIFEELYSIDRIDGTDSESCASVGTDL
jgi:hypothetical protein